MVAIAVLGTYAAASQTGKGGEQPVLVAARDLAPGTRLTASDFKVERMKVPTSLSGHFLTSVAKVEGATTLGPLRAGDLTAPSSISTANSVTPYLEVSFSIPAARALDGVLQPGETVDVLATDKSSNTASARVAAANARVLRTQDSGSASIGRSGEITITVGVTNRNDAGAIAAAVDQGQITLVRTTGIQK